MKKLILLVIIPLFYGCEKYEMISEPHLTGGKWTFVDYEIIPISSISSVSIIKSDTVCINSFTIQNFVSNYVYVSQNYSDTSIDRRFIKGRTVWEFDDNNRSLYCDFVNLSGGFQPSHPRLEVRFPNYMMNEYDKMEIFNGMIGSNTNYTFETNSIGANYPTKLKMLSPEIVTDIYTSNGMRDKAVTVRILLTFMR
jgi:hypothetical protein